MKDYYAILDIPKDATVAHIKKAYFGLVRKYPPDRHPEEFMRVREAYEVLVDANTRKQYDAVGLMPDVVRLYFNGGRKALDEGDAKRAIALLEEVDRDYPQFSIVKNLLGQAYLINGNSGKAVNIFKELVDRERNNAGFVRQLAQAYALRGWHRKAIDEFHWALTLDEDNISLWLGLIASYLETKDFESATQTAWKGLEVSNKKGWDNLELYYHIIQIDIYTEDQESMKRHLKEMKEKATAKPEESANIAWFLAALSKTIYRIGYLNEAVATVNTAYDLQPDDEEIKKIKKEVDSKYNIISELGRLEKDSSIDGHLAEMLDCELHLCDDKDCVDCEIEQFAFEMDIIVDMGTFRKDILQLKKSYPKLYNLKKEFFDKVLNLKKEEQLIDTYYRKFSKLQKLYPEQFEFIDEEEEDYNIPHEPYRRSEPKIGRNEPCPCGSGKKYKKCCGR